MIDGEEVGGCGREGDWVTGGLSSRVNCNQRLICKSIKHTDPMFPVFPACKCNEDGIRSLLSDLGTVVQCSFGVGHSAFSIHRLPAFGSVVVPREARTTQWF